MPLARMPNGEYVEVPADISPQGLAKIEAQYKMTRKQARAQGTSRSGVQETELQRKGRELREKRKKKIEGSKILSFADTASKALNPTQWLGGLGFAGATANFDDEIMGLGGGVVSALSGEGFKEGYDVAREARNQEKNEARAANPVLGTVAEIGGSFANPLGTGSRIISGAGKLLGAAAPKAGNILIKAGTKLDNAGAVTKGIATGANLGALNAAGSAESLDRVPGDMLAGGLVGGALGGTLGLLARGGQGAYRILRDRSKGNAERVALAEIAKALERGNISPEVASKMLAKANREGGDAMLMDVSPNLTSMALNLSRNPNLKNSNKMIARGEQRARTRGGRIAAKVEDTAELPKGIRDFDALREADDLTGARKGIASFDTSKGGPLDKPIVWQDDLKEAVESAPNYERLMNSAFKTAEQFGDDLGKIEQGQVIPSMRAWNYLKQEYDSIIKQAYRAGDDKTAAAYSAELGRVKEAVVKQNPDYAAYLATQRDYFQKQNALAMGEKLWKDLSKSPRLTARALERMGPDELAEARIGMIDKLVNDVLVAPNPLAVLSKVTNANNAAQRKVLETVFGGKARYNKFMRFLRTEVSGFRSDSVTRYSGQSQTSRAQQAGTSVEDDLTELGVQGSAGTAFGGLVGGATNMARALMRKANKTSDAAQDEIARLLMSTGGDDFVTGIKRVMEYKKAQLVNDEKVTTSVARAAQQPFSTQIGGE